jgi:adenylosuccinate lyase
MDQISEHQRDLTNSASSRFVAEYIGGFTAAVCRMTKVVGSLRVEKDRMAGNLEASGDMVLAEAAYILLAESGDPEAHEKIRLFTLACERNGTSLRDEMKKDPAVWKGVAASLSRSLGISPEDFFSRPGMYRGKAAEKARAIAEKYRKIFKELEEAAE